MPESADSTNLQSDYNFRRSTDRPPRSRRNTGVCADLLPTNLRLFRTNVWRRWNRIIPTLCLGAFRQAARLGSGHRASPGASFPRRPDRCDRKIGGEVGEVAESPILAPMPAVSPWLRSGPGRGSARLRRGRSLARIGGGRGNAWSSKELREGEGEREATAKRDSDQAPL